MRSGRRMRRLEATSTPAFIASPFGPETTQASVDQETTIGTFNVENPGTSVRFVLWTG